MFIHYAVFWIDEPNDSFDNDDFIGTVRKEVVVWNNGVRLFNIINTKIPIIFKRWKNYLLFKILEIILSIFLIRDDYTYYS